MFNPFSGLMQASTFKGRTAAEYCTAVHSALRRGAHVQARHLACMGTKVHPDDAELARMAYVLAPPKHSDVARPVDPSVGRNHAWLREHAKVYRGRWVALRDGNLLAEASSARALKEQVDDYSNVLVTKIA